MAQSDVAAFLARGDSQLALALRLVAPPAKSGPLLPADVPHAWLDYVAAVLERLPGFAACVDHENGPCLRARMWELAKVPAARHEEGSATGLLAQQPSVLPVLDGRVHVFHTMDNGFARELDVAVEAVRRYDLVAPRAARTLHAAAVRRVAVMRTQALEAERWSVAPDPDSGMLTALVAVPSSQRLVLYRPDLAPLVQFVAQRVGLRRTVVPSLGAGWSALFDTLGPDLDRDAYESTWVLADEAKPPALSEWELVDGPAGEAVHRGHDSYRYHDVPPFYACGVDVLTQAGARHSARAQDDEGPAPVEAMFSAGGGLAYRAPRLSWTLADEGAVLRFDFALVRGADALQARALAHWLARDHLWPEAVEDQQPDFRVPVLQLPDLRAQYRLMATRAAGDGPALRVELVQLEHQGADIVARVLVGPEGAARAEANAVQLRADDDAGRIGIACALALDSVELAWLRTALGADAPEWSLSIEVQRDGVHYQN
jgi:hypothetical protein